MYRPRPNSVWWKLSAIAAFAFFIWIVMLLQPILTPFVAAAVLAYIFDPLVEKLCRIGVPRAISAMVVMAAALLVIVFFLLMVIPMLTNQMQALINKMPQFIHWINAEVMPRFNKLADTDYILNANAFTEFWQKNSQEIGNALGKLSPTIARTGSSVIVAAVNIFLLPFLLYYFLLDWPRWLNSIKKIIPRRALPETERIMKKLDDVLGEFLRGQLTVMVVMGLIYGIGLSLTGLDNGFAIGMVAGILVFVPYLGSFTGLLLATVAAILQFQSWSGLLWVWGVFAFGQLLESYIFTPYLVGERIGLSPLTVIFALMAFGQLMGFTGMLLALPLAAICMVLGEEGLKYYYRSQLYQRR